MIKNNCNKSLRCITPYAKNFVTISYINTFINSEDMYHIKLGLPQVVSGYSTVKNKKLPFIISLVYKIFLKLIISLRLTRLLRTRIKIIRALRSLVLRDQICHHCPRLIKFSQIICKDWLLLILVQESVSAFQTVVLAEDTFE